MMAAHFVGRNSGPVFAICGRKYTKLCHSATENITIYAYVTLVLLRRSRNDVCVSGEVGVFHILS